MKRIALLLLVALFAFGGFAQGQKGDMTIDLGVGYGTMGTAGMSTTTGTNTALTQRLGAEWVIIPEMINGQFELAVGAYINNAYGTRKDGVSGTYNYSYTHEMYFSWDRKWRSSNIHRKGEGTATMKSKRDDVNFLPTVSFRYNINSKFQVYASVGLGVGVINTFDEKYQDANGFESEYKYNEYVRYSYNDLMHTQWSMSTGTKVCFSYASYVGLRYFFSDKFGVNAQTGLLSYNAHSDWGSSASYLSVGVSCKL